MNDLRFSTCVLIESLVSCRYMAEIAENQMENPISPLAELQYSEVPGLQGI